MATPAQAAAATVGAGSLAAAGAYGITQAVNGSGEESNTEGQSLNNPTVFSVQDTTESPYTNSILSLTNPKHLSLIVKPLENKGWWDWAFKNKFSKFKTENQIDPLFSNVDKGYGEDETKSLNKACDEAYKKTEADYSFENNSFLLRNIGEFCTKGTEKQDVSEPKVEVFGENFSEKDQYSGSLLSLSNNSVLLVKKDSVNKLWWQWAFKNRFKETEKTNYDTSFFSVTTAYLDQDNGDTGAKTNLNGACNEVYGSQYFHLTRNANKLLKNIKELCSIDTSETLLEIPIPTNPDLLSSSEATYSSYKLVKSNNNRLVDPSKSLDWWSWMFDTQFPKGNTETEKLPDPFKKVNSGYSQNEITGNNQTALNQACKEAYKKEREELEKPDSGSPKLKDVIKQYCTPNPNQDLTIPS